MARQPGKAQKPRRLFDPASTVVGLRRFQRNTGALGSSSGAVLDLTVVRENPGLSQMALSQVLGIVRSGVVPLLDGLQLRGLLKRAASTSDRRSHALHLTAEGNALLARADALVQQHEDRLIQKVGSRGHKQLIEFSRYLAAVTELQRLTARRVASLRCESRGPHSAQATVPTRVFSERDIGHRHCARLPMSANYGRSACG